MLKQPTTWSGLAGLFVAGLAAVNTPDWSGVINGLIVILQGLHLIIAKEAVKES